MSDGADRRGEAVATPSDEPEADAAERRRIVSSAHLVSEKTPELSEFEFGLIIATNAFNRWMVRCMRAAGVKDVTAIDVSVLHHVNHRRTEKRLSDVCFALNIEDSHIVSYSIRKLAGMGLVSSAKRGKEVFFATTEAGNEVCMRYRAVREACLVPGFSGEREENERLGEIARILRQLSGRYDQAARAATAY